MMRVLFVGDVVGRPGRTAVRTLVPQLRREYRVDVVIANGENSAGGLGATSKTLTELTAAGIDVITLGNHTCWFLDGSVSAVIGTHTHVQTADERILPGGTAYITDAGMSGPQDSVLGINRELVIKRLRTRMPQRFEVARTRGWLSGVVIEIDVRTGRATHIERINRAAPDETSAATM